ncbi:PEP-CTERM sorting domain-containing protein [Phragmitibacter flavus]|uniref:PEP-CTERM sorting domain-containing protein n=1 Tax=Phragmitibacter flavus TaxID=2576071 RepID=A0A5R8KDV1_9BACT|nr:PEP-CTERM sorting domain-containing protein [Phragmitibacter flavus]TLD70482.1 PEP-CTERM sorting domain-containing protein [Phragmitibacter flavus]
MSPLSSASLRHLRAMGGLVSALLLLATIQMEAATIYWNMGTAVSNANPTTINSAEVAGGTLSGFTAINTTSPSTGTGTYTGASGEMNAGLNTRDTIDGLLTWTLTAQNGGQLTFTDITFGSRVTGTGPQDWVLSVSVDGGASTSLASGALNRNSEWSLINPADFTSSAGTTFVFSLLGDNATATSSTTNWRIDDITLVYNFTAVPEPSRMILFGFSCITFFLRRKR